MKQRFLILLLLYIINPNNASGQELSNIGQRLIAGTSLTYIPFNNKDIRNHYNEFTWNKNIAVNLSRRIYLGLSHQNIHSRGSIASEEDPVNNYIIAGIFGQFDFLPKTKSRLFAEASWNYGNYCTCGNGDPYRRGGTNYIGLGGGYDFPITKILSIDLSFVSYNLLGQIKQKYAYTQYVVGLNIDLMKG